MSKTRVIRRYEASPYFSDRLVVQYWAEKSHPWNPTDEATWVNAESFANDHLGATRADEYAYHLSLDKPVEPVVLQEFNDGVIVKTAEISA